MHFTLIKNMGEIRDYYGNIPEISRAPQAAYERFVPDDCESARDLLAQDFMDPINDLCGTILDIYDVDYFEPGQCPKLKCWLENRMARSCDDRLRELYTVLLDYATRAVELGTGVVVEL